MVRFWAVFGLVCGVGTANANEQIDLVKQHKDYGFQGVAIIVAAYETSDQPGHEIQTIMRSSGLSQLTMPLKIGPSLKPAVVRYGMVERCGWQWGIYCHASVQWKKHAPESWKTLCVQGDRVLESVQIRSVLLTQASAQEGEVQFDGIHNCWANGGDGLRLEQVKASKP